MFALLRALPKARLGAVAYLEAYIDFVNPKLVLSRTDNNHTLWQLKRRPDVTYQVALVQNGWRFPGTEDSKSIGLDHSQKVDVYFSVGSATPDAFSFRSSEFFVECGSLNLNEIAKPRHSRNHARNINLISVFRVKTDDVTQGLNSYGGLENAMVRRGLPIFICGQSLSEADQRDEENFYKLAMPRIEKNFVRRESKLSSYDRLTDNHIFLNDLSTFGYEGFALGLRVGFIAIQPRFREIARFGKPLEFGEKGPFWTNDPSEEEIGRVLDYLLSVSDEQWERDSGWIRNQLMVHDYGNTKIRAYVEGVLTDSLESR